MMSRTVGGRIMVRDDAGVERAMAKFESDEAPDLTHPVTAGALARLRSAAAMRDRGSVRFATVLTVLAAALIVPSTIFGVVLAARWLRMPPLALVMVLMCGVAVCVGALMFILPRIAAGAVAARADLIADALLRMRRCAACGYPLAADAEPDDGYHTCSECGATWSDRRLGETIAPNGPRDMAVAFRAMLGLSAACRSRRFDDAGRPYADLPQLTHMRSPKMPGDRQVMRATWPLIALCGVMVPSGILFLLFGAFLARGSVSIWLSVACFVVAAVAAPLAIIWSLVTTRSRARLVLFRHRICPACRQRLTRSGAMLHCAACAATWRRPLRKVVGGESR
jgi:hypothetical protein